MTVITAALALLFAYTVFAQPAEMRIDYTPAAWSSR
jgi:hypothetical protein